MAKRKLDKVMDSIDLSFIKCKPQSGKAKSYNPKKAADSFIQLLIDGLKPKNENC